MNWKRNSSILILVVSFTVSLFCIEQDGTMLKKIPQAQLDLMKAIGDGDIEGFNKALQDGAEINYPCNEVVKWAPLHCAVHFGKVELVNLCIEHGASLSVRAKDRRTPLHTAAITNDICLVKAMLSTIPLQFVPQLTCLFSLLCCFNRFKKMHNIAIPKDIQSMLCSYALRARVDVDTAVEQRLAQLKSCLMIQSFKLTPYQLVIARRDGIKSEEFERPTISQQLFNQEIAELNALADLLNPDDNAYRRTIIKAAVYKNFKARIPIVSNAIK